jgi:hypothetical protein
MILLKGNAVYRDSEEIGIYNPEDGICTLTDKQAPAIKGQIRQAVEAAELSFKGFALLDSTEADNSEQGETSEPLTSGEVGDKPEIPPCPEQDPQFGDLTPSVVEWYHEYQPEEYKARYVDRERKTHLD